MASPVDAGRSGTNGTTATTSAVVNLPGSISAGDLLVVLHTANAGGTITFPAGWDQLQASQTPHGADDTVSVAVRLADGTEGATISVTQSNAKFSSMAWRITGAEDPNVFAPEFSAENHGNGVTVDPLIVTPTGGSQDYLFLYLVSHEGENTSFVAGGTVGYSNRTLANSGIASTTATNSRTWGASKQATAASEDPGTTTMGTGGGGNWLAWCMAIHPSGSVAAFSPQILMVL